MSLLKPAQNEQGFLKVGIYGGPGSGKTLTALMVAFHIGKKVAIIDTERGSDFYKKEFPFDVVHTRFIGEAIRTLEEAVAEGYDVLIIDQMTHFWESAQDEYISKEKDKYSKTYQVLEQTGNLPWTAWRGIKKPYKRLVHEALSAPIHVFLLGRLKIEYQRGSDGSPVKVGESFDAEKQTHHEPNILVKMEFKKPKQWLAYIEKDRSRTFQGRVFTNPTGDMFDEVIAKLSATHASLPDESEDSDIELKEEPIRKEQVKIITLLCKKEEVTDIEEKLEKMSAEKAGELINKMTLGDFSYWEGGE